MTCSELERLSVAGAPEAELSAHLAACASCAALGKDLETVGALVASLRSPAMAPELRESLFAIPRMTVSCEGADGLIAAALNGELPATDRTRLEFHVSRCPACAESAATLLGMRDLAKPAPAPWLAGRIVLGPQHRRDGVIGHESERLLALPATVAVDTEVARQRDNPGGQREAPVVAVEVLEDLQEDLLGELLGVLPLQREVVSHRVDLLPEHVHQLPPGLVLALAAPVHEGLFIGAVHMSSKP